MRYIALMITLLLIQPVLTIAVEPAGYLRENVHDTSVGPDEAAVNVKLVNSRWPDCTTLESAVRSIWRIEGVTDADDQAKAFALWKWFRILTSATGGGYAYEGADLDELVWDPHKILTVYGHHQCDGLSWSMVGLWRSVGRMAFDECHHGHTTAALRYRDADGHVRYHSFDPQGRFYYWDDVNNRVSTWQMPVMGGTVYRHITAPRQVHSLRTSLRFGETIERNWQNTGHIIPNGMKKGSAELRNPRTATYYEHRAGRTDGTYNTNGEQVQRLTVGGQGAALHPAKAGEMSATVYRLAPPYVAVDGTVTAKLFKGRDGDTCRLLLSRDGGDWLPVAELEKAGPQIVTIDLGREARKAGRPSIYAAYDVRLKVEMQTAGERASVGLESLEATIHRMLNKRTLPNLMPGDNMFRLSFDKLADGAALELKVDYELKGEKKSQSYVVVDSPFYFRVDAPGVELKKIDNYDQAFGDEQVRMLGYSLRLASAPMSPSASLPAEQGEAAFASACPHPFVAVNRANQKIIKDERRETDPIQTSGFLPQSRERRDPDARMAELVKKVRAEVEANGGHSPASWRAAQELGNYPAALDTLIELLPRTQIDMTIFFCKALAQIGDAKAAPALLAKWEKAGPRGVPGTRYIPDALAACGAGPEVVPALVAPLKQCRFDVRFHIAHALGEIGGEQAESTLRDLAKHDPFPAVCEQAKLALKKLESKEQK